MSENEENYEENPLDRLSEEFDLRTNLLAALMQPGITLTHVVAVASYSDEDGQEAIMIYGGPDQPSWVSKALLSKGMEVWNTEEEFEREAYLSSMFQAPPIIEDDDDDDDY